MKCPNCEQQELIWDSSADSNDCGYELDGIVSLYHCTNCGAEIEIFVPNENQYKEENDGKFQDC